MQHSSIAHFSTKNPLEANEYAELAGRTQVADAVDVEKQSAILQKKIARAESAGEWNAAEKLYLQLEDLELGAINEPSVTGQNILPLVLRTEGLKQIDMKSGFDGHAVAEAIKKSKSQGATGLMLNNVFDPVGMAC